MICESDLEMSNKRAYRLNDDAIQAIKEIQCRLRMTSPGIAGPDDPLSFDPESDAMGHAVYFAAVHRGNL